MKHVIRLIAMMAACLVLSACKVTYSFSGTSIQAEVKTVTIAEFEYKALRVNPSLANDMSEQLRNQFRRMTRLEQVDMDGDLEISGTITGYEVRATAVTANETAAQNRLTVSISVNFMNRLFPEDSFENKNFSAYADFDATQSLDAVESSLCSEILDKLIDDIFNATVAQW
ncbi:MAG: LPS assembly lipoprotein LptE [Bacteroidales bacterium]|nr:LPS assembly lipoprotein LptE [Bacteroidales bacterium]